MRKFLLFLAAVAVIAVVFVQQANAQITVTVTNPTNTTPNLTATYASLALALTDLNAVTAMTGPVTLTLTAGGSETAPPTGLTIGSATLNPVLSATNTVTVIKSSGTVTLNAGVGTATPGSAAPDGILKIAGADYITIDGLTFTDGNITNPATMEFGIALFKLSLSDGAQYNTIQNCTFNMQRVNDASGSGPMVNGSVAINVVNSIPTAATTSLTPTTAAGTNSYNKFYTNTTNSGNYGIVLNGYAASTPFTAGDTGNDIGGTSLSTGNTILNYGGAAASTQPSAGIRANNQWGVNISYNTINNNNGTGVNHPSTLRGIYAQAGTSASATINYNNLTIQGGGTTSQVSVIENAIGSTASSNTITLNNNTIQAAYTTATTGILYGIYNSSSAASVNINNNNISGVSSTNLAGTGTHVIIETGSPAIATVNSNSIANISRSGASGSWRIIKTTSPANLTVNGNTIDGMSWTTVASTGSIDAFYSYTSAVGVTVSNNIIRNLSTPATGTLRGIVEYGVAGTKIIQGNQIYNFSTTAGGAGGATFTGILSQVGTVDINGNTIYSLNSTGTTGGTGGVVAGIIFSGGTTYNCYKNKIYDLSSTSTTPGVYGISITSGTTFNVYNNLIGDLRCPAANTATPLAGINITGGTTSNIYYNTVNLNATSTGAVFGSSAIYASTTPTVTLRNNIFVNTSTPNGATGYTAAYRRTSVTLTTYGSASNNNLFYAGTSGTYNLIHYDGTNSYLTLATYKTAVGPTRDAVSISENPDWLSTTGSDATFLHIDPTTGTLIESGGANISGITDDYDGNTRQGNPGYTGTGTAPDIGADEFEGFSPAPVITLNSITPSGNQCTATARDISVEVTTPSGTITGVTITYNNGSAVGPVAMTNSGGNTWIYTIPAASPSNTVVTWSVTATSSVPLSSTYNGASYQDDPANGLTATASVSATPVCSGSPTDLSVIVGNASAAPTYTAPPAVSNPTTDEDFGNITITKVATTILTNASAINTLVGTIGTASGTAGSYSDFTSFGPYSLEAGQIYNFSASTLQQTTAYGNAIGIYIDYNRNGVFSDAGEAVYVSATTTLGAHTETGSFTVPSGANAGKTRMRIVVNEGAVTGPTMSVSWGEYEEYMMNITIPASAFSWSDGTNIVGTTNPLTVNPIVNTTYTCTVTALGCPIVSNGIPVAVLASPTIDVQPVPSIKCAGELATFSVTATGYSLTYQWRKNLIDIPVIGNPSAGTSELSLANVTEGDEASYDVVVTSCGIPVTSDAVTLTVNPLPTSIVSPAGTVNICFPNTQLLTGTTDAATPLYQWQLNGSDITGATNPTYTADASGDYSLVITNGPTGCATTSATVTVIINPLPSAVTITPSAPIVPGGAIQQLTASGGTVAVTLLNEDFNGFVPGWTTVNNSTGGDPAAAAWMLYLSGPSFHSNDNSIFVLSNSDAQGSGGTTMTELISPVLNSSGFTTLSLSFWHYFNFYATPDEAMVEVSTDGGSSWVSPALVSYVTDQGTATGWVNAIIDLTPYINQSNLRIRFNYYAEWGYYWGVDNVSITGDLAPSFTWSPTTYLFTDPAATVGYLGETTPTVYTKPQATTTYTALATSTEGCTSSATVLVTSCPVVPGSLAAVNVTSTSFDLGWASSQSDHVNPVVYTIDVASNINFLVGIVPGSPFTVTDPTVSLPLSGLTPNTTYFYRIKATGDCTSAYASGSVATCPGTPGSLATSNIASTSFDLSWVAPAGGTASAIQYTVDVSADPGFTPLIASYTVNHPTVTQHVAGLTGFTQYYYRVKATGSCASAYAEGTVTTLACFEPVAFTALATSGSTAYLSWTEPSIAPIGGYEYEVRTVIGGTLVVSGTTPGLYVSVTSLTASTDYISYVRSVCDGGTYSGWETATFTTTSCSVETIPYAENFESYTPPAYGCLTVEDVNEDGITWYTATGPTHSGTKKMTIGKSDPGITMDDWVMTKGLQLEGGRSYSLSFWYRAVSSTYTEKMEVMWGNAPLASVMTESTTFSPVAFNSTTYTLGTGVFTVTETGVYWIGWHCNSDPGKAGIYLDDLSVCELPSVPEIAGPAHICKPETGIYTATVADAVSYVWTVPAGATIDGPLNTSSISVIFSEAAVSGDVTVYGVNDCGNGPSTAFAVVVDPQLPVNIGISSNYDIVCDGAEVTFTAFPVNEGPNPVYQWTVNGFNQGTNSPVFVWTPANGDVVVGILTSDAICATGNPASSNAIVITVLALPSATITGTLTACVTTTLTAVTDAASPAYVWYKDDLPIDGQTASTLVVTESGAYKVKVTDGFTGCQQTSAASDVTINPLPVASVSGNLTACVSTTLTAVTDAASPAFVWYREGAVITGETSETLVATLSGAYKVKVTNGLTGCEKTSATYTVVINPLPTATISGSQTICNGASTTLPVALTGNQPWSITYTDGVNPPVTITGITSSDMMVNGGLETWTSPTVPAPNWIQYASASQESTIVHGGSSSAKVVSTSGTLNFRQEVAGIVGGQTYNISYWYLDNDAAASTRIWSYWLNNTTTLSDNATELRPNYTYPLVSVDDPNWVHVSYTLVAPATANKFRFEVRTYRNLVTNVFGGSIYYDDFSVTPGIVYPLSLSPTTTSTYTITNVTDANGCSNTGAGSGTVTVNPLLPVSVEITASADDVCLGTTVTYTATPTNGGIAPTFEWHVNGGPSVGTSNTYTYDPSIGDAITCIVTSDETCATGNPATGTFYPVVNPILPVSVSISADANPVCPGTLVTFTAVPFNGGLTPSYQWYNGIIPVGEDSPTYAYVPVEGDAILVVMTSSEACQIGGPATSNTVTMTFVPVLPVSVSITADANPVCDGATVTFTAVPVNGGLTPSYQWYNGLVPVGTDSPVYAYEPVDGDVISVVLTSSEACKSGSPATSNEVEMTVNPILPVSVSIVSDATTVCAGTTVTFTATPVNEGSTPSYRWNINLNPAGNDSPVFAYEPVDGDVVSVELTSSEACTSGNPATSNEVAMTVNPLLPVSVTVVASANPVVGGANVTFTATPVNGGTTPVYQWFVNGSAVGTNSTVYTYAPFNNDEVYCMLTSDALCATGSPATSNTIIMVVTVPGSRTLQNITIHDGQTVCYDASGTITVAGRRTIFVVEPGGDVTMIAGTKISIQDGFKVMAGGYYLGKISTEYCGYVPPPLPAVVTGEAENPFVSLTASFIIYPNPTTGNFILEQKSGIDYAKVKVEVYGMRGERMLTEEIIGQRKHEVMFTDVPTGLYFVKVIAGDYVETIKLIKSR